MSWLTPKSAIVLVGWVLLAPAVGFVLLRLAGADDRSARFFAIETLTPWLLLPLAVVLVTAVVLRARPLAVVALGSAALLAVWTAPDLRWWASPQPRPTSESFVLASANARATSTSFDAAAASLAQRDADVLVVVELTPPLLDAMHRNHDLDRLPNRAEDARKGFFGSAIFSRFPITDHEVLEVDGHTMLRATVQLPGATTTIV
ncbi:MAG: hypothetical protein V7636_1100, partial [Actinomycetota bacterium]